MKRTIQAIISFCMFFILAVSGSLRVQADTSNPPTGRYALVAWNDLGMHCMDYLISVKVKSGQVNDAH